MPPRLAIHRLRVGWRAGPEGLALEAHPATAVRGRIGAWLRDAVCETGAPTCEGCPLVASCPYGVLFERQPLPAGWPRRFATPPHPWVVSATDGSLHPRIEPGHPFDVEVGLIGSARACADAVLVAVREAHESLGCALARFEAVDELVLPDAPDGLARVRLRTESPVELRDGGRILEELDLAILTARLTERLDLLALAWGSGSGSWEPLALRAQAARLRPMEASWRTVRFRRRSRRAGRVPMQGIVGSCVVEDVPASLAGLWRCAEQVHVGGNAALGFGRLVLEELAPAARPRRQGARSLGSTTRKREPLPGSLCTSMLPPISST